MKIAKLIKSTGIVSVCTLLSRILGFVRDMVCAYYFGASRKFDGFLVAFRIPNLFRKLVAEGALTISFIPVYTDYLENQGEKKALELAQKTLTILISIVVFLVALGILFSPQIVKLFGLGFTNQAIIDLTVSLNRVLFPYLICVSFVAFSMGVLNSHRYYFAPAFAPIFLNVGFITGVVLISRYFREPLYGVAAGILCGGVLQVIMQIPYLIKSGFRLKISFDFKHPGIRKIFALIAPTLFGTAVYHINLLLNTILASLLPDGSISYLYYTDRLIELVLGIFVIAIGSVIFVEMSYLAAKKDFKQLGKVYSGAVSSALFMAIPAAVALAVIGLPIISVLFQRGEFTAFNALMTYNSLMCGALGIGSVAVTRITTPTFYSIKDVRIPVISAAVALVINISLGYILMNSFLLHAGLALANSIAAIVQMAINVYFIKRRIPDINLYSILSSFFRVILASAIMGGVLYFMKGLFNWHDSSLFNKILNMILLVGSGGMVYIFAAYILRVREIHFFINLFKRKFIKNR